MMKTKPFQFSLTSIVFWSVEVSGNCNGLVTNILKKTCSEERNDTGLERHEGE